jgi:DNA repair protein RadC
MSFESRFASLRPTARETVDRNDPHNHPSDDPSPSAAGIQLTRQLREAAAAVDIPLLEHVIIGRHGADSLGRGYYSFREAGLL